MKRYKPIFTNTHGRERKTMLFLVFLLPTLGILLLLTVFPLIYSLRLSFMSWELLRPGAKKTFVAFENYREILIEPRFLSSLAYTAKVIYTAIPLEILLGIAIALLLHREIKGRSIFQLLVMLPMIVAPVVTGSMARLLFNEQFGPVNYLLQMLRFTDVKLQWLSQPPLVQKVIILMEVWRWTPFAVLVMFAGLTSVPETLYEAAQIDGASNLKLFRYITLPFLKKHLVIVVFIRLITLFTLYDTVYVISKGGPGTSTETVSFYTYLTGFKFFSMGKAAAMSYIVLIVTIAIIANFIRVGITKST